MREHLPLVVAFACGLLLGVVFFGGLWLTVRFAISSSRIAFWFLTSFLARTSIALGGFYLVARDGWEGLLSCLLGFIAARLLVIWLTGPTATSHGTGTEAGHAT
jgi:F1F0 ATPase subunit 2